MVKLGVHYMRATSFAVLTISLVAAIVLLGVLFQHVLVQAHAAKVGVAAEGASPPSPNRAVYLSRLAYLVGLVLLLTVAILAAVVIHYILTRANNPPERFKPMGHVDSWTEAGKRVKAENAPPVPGYDMPGPAPKEKPDEE